MVGTALLAPIWSAPLRVYPGAAAANLQTSIQKNSRPSEFNRPLTSITLNLNRDLPVDRCRISLQLLKLPILNIRMPDSTFRMTS